MFEQAFKNIDDMLWKDADCKHFYFMVQYGTIQTDEKAVEFQWRVHEEAKVNGFVAAELDHKLHLGHR